MKMKSRYKGKQHETNINMAKDKKEKNPVWGEKMKERMSSNQIRKPLPSVITEPVAGRIKQVPSIVDLEKVQVPDNIVDVFDILPTMALGRHALLEQSKMNKVLTMDEELYLQDEAEEFDEEVEKQFDDTFGSGRDERMREREEMMARKSQDMMMAGREGPRKVDDSMLFPDRERMMPRKRREINEIDENMI